MITTDFFWPLFGEVDLTPYLTNHANTALLFVKHSISLIGASIILIGAIYAFYQFLIQVFRSHQAYPDLNFDTIRLDLVKAIILGLEFIIASDVIETMTAPDYYSLGILGGIVIIRTFLNYSLSKDLNNLSKRNLQGK